MRRRGLLVAAVLLALALVYVDEEAYRTLQILDRVERERDRWQRPEAVLDALALRPGETVVDLGSGAGYFAMKIAPRVAPGGEVLALDLRRESLAFLWIRARRAGLGNLKVILSAVDDPRVPPGTEVHAALIANTLHEMLAPGPVLDALGRVMPTGARLVVIDRAPLLDRPVVIHELSADDAQRLVTAHGFHLVERVDSFVARDSEGESWWLMTFRR